MSALRRKITEKALSDIRSIGEFSARHWGKAQSRQYLMALRERFDWLVDNPEAGTLRDDIRRGVRSYPEGSHTIYYLIAGPILVILSVRHHAQDIPGPRDLR